MKFLLNLCIVLLLGAGFSFAVSCGLSKELDRQDAEMAYHVQQCETNPNYYKDFCEKLLGK